MGSVENAPAHEVPALELVTREINILIAGVAVAFSRLKEERKIGEIGSWTRQNRGGVGQGRYASALSQVGPTGGTEFADGRRGPAE